MEAKQFTRAELKARNSKKDAVIVINNAVYDVTKFLEEHPGGEEVLLERAGGDATEPFEDVGHSSDARELMKKYLVGEVVAEERVAVKATGARWGGAPADQAADQSSAWSGWLVPLVLGVAATLLYRYLFL